MSRGQQPEEDTKYLTSTAFSDSFAGSTPRRDLARSEMYHATWSVVDLWAAFSYVLPEGLA